MPESISFIPEDDHHKGVEINNRSLEDIQKVCPFLGGMATEQAQLLLRISAIGNNLPKDEPSDNNLEGKAATKQAGHSEAPKEIKEVLTVSTITTSTVELADMPEAILPINNSIHETEEDYEKKEVVTTSISNESFLVEAITEYLSPREAVDPKIKEVVQIIKAEEAKLLEVVDKFNTIEPAKLPTIDTIYENKLDLPIITDEELKIFNPEPDTVVEQIEKILSKPETEVQLPLRVDFELVDPIEESLNYEFDSEVEEFWKSITAQVETDTKTVNNTFVSQLSVLEVEETADILDFNIDTKTEMTQEITEQREDIDTREFVNAINENIDQLPEEENVQAEDILKSIEKIAEKIIEIKNNDPVNIDVETIIKLEAEIETKTEELMKILYKQIKPGHVKRFVRKIIQDKQINVNQADQDTQYVDEGTHEKKPNLSTFISGIATGIDHEKQKILSAIGMYALMPL